MRSRHHFPVSALVGVGLAAVVDTAVGPLTVVAYAALLGTAVDFDHFAIARIRTGSWAPLRRCVADPRMALTDQTEIFDRGDVGPWTRLASHTLITVVLAGALAAVAPALAVVTAVVLAVHVGCDLAWDAWRRRTAR